MKWAVTFLAVANFAVLGCGRHWPTVQGVADRGFADSRRPVDSLDILPLDVDFAISSHARAPADEILARFNATAMGTIHTELLRRGYRVRAAMEWDGSYVQPDGTTATAIEPVAIAATADSLRGYGYAQDRSGGELLFPYLPHRLGEHTGSDTTLYVGGWAFIGKKRTSTGAKVAKGVLIGAVIVIVIVAAIAGLKKSGGSLAKGAGKIGSAAGRGARVLARSAGHAAKAFGHVAQASGKVLAKTGARTLQMTGKLAGRTTLDVLDAFGHTNTHILVYGGEPEYYERDLPRGGYSRMEIEMTLVDNTDGRTLWHARQEFPADAASSGDTAEVMRRMLASLPAQR